VDAAYTFSKLIDSASPSTGAAKSRTLPNTQIPRQYYRIERAPPILTVRTSSLLRGSRNCHGGRAAGSSTQTPSFRACWEAIN